MRRKALLAALVGVLLGGVFVVQAEACWRRHSPPCYYPSSCYITFQPAAPPPAEEAFTHLNATIYELREAKEELRNLKGLKEDIRDKAIGAIDAAIDQTKKCFADLGLEYKYKAPEKSPYPPGETNKHVRHALRELREAKEELKAVRGVTDEHRATR